jgi:hypothetical protein
MLNKSQLRLVQSYLLKLLKQFLVVDHQINDPVGMKQRLAAIWREKGAKDLHQLTLRDAERTLEQQPLRDADYHYKHYQLFEERYREAYRKSPEKGDDFAPLDPLFNTAVIAMKLRQTCLLLAHGQVYRWGFQPTLLDVLFPFIEEQDLLDIPAISIYYYGIKMLQSPDQEAHFRSFKSVLLENGQHFSPTEVRDLYMLAINYGIRRVNDGQRAFFHDILDFYKDGLEHAYLLEHGQLSRFTYHNVVSVALQVGDANWAEAFITRWTNTLDRRYQERMESFNRAKIAYHRKDYDAAIPLLQRANYHDLLLNLGARTLLLKIYFELGEFDALDSHIEAFQSYLSRKAALGYHRKNYRALIRFTRKILQLRPSDHKGRATLIRNIQEESVLTEKAWLLEQLAG